MPLLYNKKYILMKNLFFIHRFPFNKEAYIRDEFDYLISKNFNVKYLDISSLLKKKRMEISSPDSLQQYIIPFASRKEFAKFLYENSKDTLIITDVGLLTNSAWMYLAIFKARLPYMLFENSVFPKMKQGKNKVKRNGLNLFLTRFNYSKLYKKPIELFQYYIAKSMLVPAVTIITAKPKLSSEKKVLQGSNTLMRYAMSLDYKTAMQVGNENRIEEPYAVFVDQNLIHHPDFITNQVVHSFSAEEYYGELNKYLSDFSKSKGIPVVIAAHPRRKDDAEQDFNSKFALYYNQTAHLIKHAQVVLMHYSTAINYVVIFKKPVLFLDSDLFNNSNIKAFIHLLTDFFETNPVNTSVICNLSKSAGVIKKEKYVEYFTKYIKHPLADDKTLKELFMETIDKMK